MENSIQKSRLFGMSAYEVGPMDRVKDGGVGWRRMLIPKLHKLGIMVFDPTDKPTFGGYAIEDEKIRDEVTNLKKDGKFEEAKNLFKPLRLIDLRMCDLSSIIIAHVDLDVHMCGTYEELFLSNRQKKPILVHIPQGKENIPHWILSVIPSEHIFSTWDDLMAYLENVAYGRDLRTFNRWMFFDFEKMRNRMLAVYDNS